MNYELVLEEKNFLHLCQEIKELLEKRKITVSMHSSQFFSLASDDKMIRENSQTELIYYANILSLIAKEAIITIQLNSKRELVERLGEEKYLQWVAEAVQKLPANVLAKISLKNEARGFWNSANLYKFHRYYQEKYQIFLPLAWDNYHELANPSRISESRENWEWFNDTWKKQTPLFYWSESCGQNKIAHCDFFHHKTLPPTSIPVWVCETKMKELSLKELLESQKINIEEAAGKKER
ncbi:Putative UV damage endonuclease UvdE [endosymbiont DhMRE of Dentiscutata heterogama]|nr:Putative UV damage endonuclease UvdE [endosymbiont DhMRE of Dentiscutata heterogama]